MKKTALMILAFCVLSTTPYCQIYNEVFKYESNISSITRTGHSLDIKLNDAVAGAWSSNVRDSNGVFKFRAGTVLVFQRVNGVWSNVQKLDASTVEEDHRFGFTVHLGDTELFVAATREDVDANLSHSGVVYVYEKDINQLWKEKQKITPKHQHSFDEFGKEISSNNEYLAVGNEIHSYDLQDSNYLQQSGAVWVYKKNNIGNWVHHQKLVSPSRKSKGFFGKSVHVSGNVMAITSSEDSVGGDSSVINFAGALYVFNLNPNNEKWEFAQKLRSNFPNEGAGFGSDCDATDDLILVGSEADCLDLWGNNCIEGAGAAFLYKKDPMTNRWSLHSKIVNSSRFRRNYFGTSVDIEDNTILINSIYRGDNKASGEVNVYELDTQSNLNKIETIRSGVAVESFGHSAVVSKGAILVGAPYVGISNAVRQSGAVYLYEAPNVSLVEKKANNRYMVYPNPSNGRVTLHFNEKNAKNIKVFDANGRMVMETNIQDNELMTTTLELGSARGIYQICVTSKDWFNCAKLIVNH